MRAHIKLTVIYAGSAHNWDAEKLPRLLPFIPLVWRLLLLVLSGGLPSDAGTYDEATAPDEMMRDERFYCFQTRVEFHSENKRQAVKSTRTRKYPRPKVTWCRVLWREILGFFFFCWAGRVVWLNTEKSCWFHSRWLHIQANQFYKHWEEFGCGGSWGSSTTHNQVLSDESFVV